VSRFLLDTHAFLYWVADAPHLSVRARAAIAASANECWVSIASCWEMAIKASLGKLRIPLPLARFVSEHMAENAFRPLAIELRHAAQVAEMPFHHRDPFDRLLAAQALAEDLTVVSADASFDAYGVRRLW
jgi:PIN domain nuclease of toxin-antitoxin system